jgi:hypothetical protein
MKVEYEWHAEDECGRLETITGHEECGRRRGWRRALCLVLGVLVAAALAYSGYVALS